MHSDAAVLAATVILLFPIGYFFLASPAFLLVKLDVPQVTQLLRGMFSIQFVMIGVAGAIATLIFAASGRPAFAIVTGLVGVLAIAGRGRFLEKMDAELIARDGGDTGAVRKLRRLHWAGMLGNAVLLIALVSSIPLVAA